jgi:ABC-type amino acid transport substrate-binding protein
MKRKSALLFLLGSVLLSLTTLTFSQSSEPVPTLVPPTLVATPNRGVSDSFSSESVIARIMRDGKVRVGVLYNEPPFGELTVRGEVRGFDADLARKIAEAWGVDVEFVQVTRQNGIQAIQNQTIDLLIAAQVRRRDLDVLLEFSQTYRVSKQAMMVRNDDPAETLFNMTSRTVGYVLGTESEKAVLDWQAKNGITLLTQPFLTLDQAISALFANQIDGVVGRNEQLLRVSADQVFSAKILEDAVAIEPFAIAMPRQDVNLRNLVNKTLQYLQKNKTMESLYGTYFQGQAFAEDALPIYNGVSDDEAPQLSQFPTDIRFPQQYIMPNLLQNRVLRVAGMVTPPEDASEADKRVYEFNRQLLEQMTRRWGVQIQYVDGGDVFELLELGQADLAINVGLDWAVTNRVDFSQPYMFHGDRLMIKPNSGITGFNELRGKWVAIMHTDTGAQDRAQVWADSINARVRFYSAFEQDAAQAMLVENNADVTYGDSLKLLQHLLANPNNLTLTDRWYSRVYVGFALPRNDIDFRLLVDYTLQEMTADGSLNNLLALVLPPNSDLPKFDIIPGVQDYYGLRVAN